MGITVVGLEPECDGKQSLGPAMTVNTLPNAFARSSSPATAGPRLYLREDALDQGVARVLRAGDRLKAVTEDVRRQHDLSWSEARCLCELLGAAQPVMVLANALGLSKQAMLKTLDALESRALLVRTQDTRDARRRLVSLTAHGTLLSTELASILRTCLANAYRIAGSEAVAGCDQVLTTLTETQERAEPHPPTGRPR